MYVGERVGSYGGIEARSCSIVLTTKCTVYRADRGVSRMLQSMRTSYQVESRSQKARL